MRKKVLILIISVQSWGEVDIVNAVIAIATRVKIGMRIGDLDPQDDPSLCNHVSDKSRTVVAGVLEAIRSKFDLMDLK